MQVFSFMYSHVIASHNMSYILCVLEVTYRCQKMVDKEPIELEILDTVNKVQHV